MESIQVAPIKPTISIDLLDRIDVRVGTIERVEEVPNPLTAWTNSSYGVGVGNKGMGVLNSAS